MKPSFNGHHLLSQADELIETNIQLKKLLNRRTLQTKSLFVVLLSLSILLSAVCINKAFFPRQPIPIITSTDQIGDMYPAHNLQKVSAVLKDDTYPHFIYLYKEMTNKICQAFWDAALIKSHYVMHNYRLRWMAECMYSTFIFTCLINTQFVQ